MKTNETTIGYIAIMQVQGKRVIVALPQSQKSFAEVVELSDHFQHAYSAVVVDIRDIWVN